MKPSISLIDIPSAARAHGRRVEPPQRAAFDGNKRLIIPARRCLSRASPHRDGWTSHTAHCFASDLDVAKGMRVGTSIVRVRARRSKDGHRTTLRIRIRLPSRPRQGHRLRSGRTRARRLVTARLAPAFGRRPRHAAAAALLETPPTPLYHPPPHALTPDLSSAIVLGAICAATTRLRAPSRPLRRRSALRHNVPGMRIAPCSAPRL
ncbi:hypothetical protein DFH06DRAFT_1327749 [Mycena polygramma]|nr:hypothetical protein DFH06DRAFT_1327749 [Mycena polygramma]